MPERAFLGCDGTDDLAVSMQTVSMQRGPMSVFIGRMTALALRALAKLPEEGR
jgi:hypothetical protein